MDNILLQLQTQNSFFNWPGWTFVAAISAFIAAVATACYTVLTYRLLSATKDSIDIANGNRETSNKLAEFQIYSKLADQLSSDQALKILNIIEADSFEIEEISGPPPPGLITNRPKTKIWGKNLRNYVLSPIEDLAKFNDDGLLSIESIDAGFGNTILMLGNSKQVVDYIKHLRTKVYYSNDVHCGFETLYEQELNCCKGPERAKYTNHFKSNAT